MSNFPSRAEVQSIKMKYPKGTKIRCIFMNDGRPIKGGTIGEVDFVDDIGSIFMKWPNGRTTPLIPNYDDFEIVDK